MPAPHPHIEVYEALREFVRTELGLSRYKVGGWEVQPGRDISLGIFGYEGEFSRRGGSRGVGTQDSMAVQVTLRGSKAVTEAEMYPLRDSLKYLLETFTHPLLMGIEVRSWKFEIIGDGTFDNVLTLTGSIGFQTRAHPMSAQELIGKATAIILSHLEQVPPGGSVQGD